MSGFGADQWVILSVGALVAASCALVGTFLVLRKVAMLGDAISHAVLPGIAIAFLFTESRAFLPMFLGAAALGVVTVFLVGLLNRTRRIQEDASIGVVFPALFSIGVILISRYAGDVHLDLDCVLYGEIAYAPLDVVVLGGVDYGPRAVWTLAPILLLNLMLVFVFYKELKITSFDPDLAAALGLSPILIHYLLMGTVSVTVVGAFESVGAILVVAMLIVPPAAAYLLTNRLATMLVLAVAIGMASSTIGYFVASWWDCSISGAMAATAGLFFVLAFLFSPAHGFLARLSSRLRLARRFREQLILLHLKAGDEGVSMQSLRERFRWSATRLRHLISHLEQEGLLEQVDDGIRLTARGVEAIKSAGTTPLMHS